MGVQIAAGMVGHIEKKRIFHIWYYVLHMCATFVDTVSVEVQLSELVVACSKSCFMYVCM